MIRPHPDIEQLARLARLRLSGEEAEHMGAELRSIVDQLTILNSIGEARTPEFDTAGAPLRADVVAPDPLVVSLEEMAPEWVEGYFLVPNPPGVRPGRRG